MRSFLSLALVCVVFGKDFSQNLMSDKVNIATLIVDYDSNLYEEGTISYFDCDECTNDSLPFAVQYNPPLDFGDITFSLTNNVAFFEATIVWMGQGSISNPASFSTSFPFNVTGNTYQLSDQITYYDMTGTQSSDVSFINEANLALEQIKSLPIVEQFSNHDIRIGIYFYPPTVGVLDPTVAKWVIFLYTKISGQNGVEENDGPDLSIYPNPVNNYLSIQQVSEGQTYEILSVSGRKVMGGTFFKTNATINVEDLPEGTYLLKILSKGGEAKVLRFVK